MDIKREEIYPNCQTINRLVKVGGHTKSQLIQNLKQGSILLNEFAEKLFADDKFTVSDEKYSVSTVELKVRNLGYSEGATIPQIYKKANQLGLELCPLELGPYLRIEYLDQPEGNSNTYQQNKAPYGSITVASKILTDDHNFPKGFYLRKIDGTLWLRGYVCDDTHIWEPDDHFIFVKQ